MDLDAQLNCSGCGYDLTGGAREGRCPECGQAYDVSTGKGVTKRSAAMEAHYRGDRVVYLFKLWTLILLAVICAGLGGLRGLMVDDPARPIAIGLLFGGLFAFGALATWFTERK